MAAGAIAAPRIIPITRPLIQKSKNHIDTRTPVSIQSDSAGVLIFFTLDGSKPVGGRQGSDVSTRKYTDPILLPPGRVSVRAVAVTRDGRQSSVVTKVFSVNQVGAGITTEEQEDRQHKSEGTCCSAGSEVHLCTTAEPTLTHSGPRFLDGSRSSKGFKAPAAAWVWSSLRSRSADLSENKHLSGKQEQREPDFLWCPRCLSVRPSDPFARFCPQCGVVLPLLATNQLPPAERGQLFPCLSCHSLVPVNTRTCLVCEESVDGEQQRLAGPAAQVGVGGRSAPAGKKADGTMTSCSRCNRLNRGDARFCDWCGSKLGHALGCVMCWRCGASGPRHALHCSACGAFLQRHGQRLGDVTQPQQGSIDGAEQLPHLQADSALSGCDGWKATPPSNHAPTLKVAPPSADQSTQTVGLYYPSAAELQKKNQQREQHVIQEGATRDRRPPLTAISPGRGYWRKQLDHVCAHLRSYTQNHSSFRILLAEPRLGQMISAVVQEGPDDHTLTLSFRLAAPPLQTGRLWEAERGWSVGGASFGPGGDADGASVQTLSSVTEQFFTRTSSKAARKNLEANLKLGSSVTDRQLLKELGPEGGRIRTIQQLLDQGADPSCCGSGGRHALAVAVLNGHHDALPVLVQRGADVDQQSGPMKNAALHEAAALGSDGLRSAELLLRCQASVSRRNAAGQTAYDVALSSGCLDMASLLAGN